MTYLTQDLSAPGGKHQCKVSWVNTMFSTTRTNDLGPLSSAVGLWVSALTSSSYTFSFSKIETLASSLTSSWDCLEDPARVVRGKIFRIWEPSTYITHCYRENHLQNTHAHTLLIKILWSPKKEYSNCPWFSVTADFSQIIRGREEQINMKEIIKFLKLYYTNYVLASPKLNLETKQCMM